MDDKHHAVQDWRARITSCCMQLRGGRGSSYPLVGSSLWLVADHDFTKFGMIPSVTMLHDIPEKPDDSFYREQVFVGLKNAVLEASSPVYGMHATELGKILTQEGFSFPLLFLYTDGGPDHNLSFLSVQLSLIALFIHFDLDMIAAVKTAPYHSWKNPCERVNCVLNLGLHAGS